MIGQYKSSINYPAEQPTASGGGYVPMNPTAPIADEGYLHINPNTFQKNSSDPQDRVRSVGIVTVCNGVCCLLMAGVCVKVCTHNIMYTITFTYNVVH